MDGYPLPRGGLRRRGADDRPDHLRRLREAAQRGVGREPVEDLARVRWISDAEVTEPPFTAFTSKPEPTGSLPGSSSAGSAGCVFGQGELFPGYRYHAAFTDNPLPTLDAESCHRRHAIVEGVIADLKTGPLAHLPSGRFTANAASLAFASISFTLTRATGAAAGGPHARATTPTLRRRLITVSARIASSARRLVLQLPHHWAWQHGWQTLFDSGCGPPVLR